MPVTNGYLTTLEAGAYIGRQYPDGSGILDDVVTVASRNIDRHCGRHFYNVTATRLFDATTPYRLDLGPFNDLVSVTTLKADHDGNGTFEVTYGEATYQLSPPGATSRAPAPQPYTCVELLNGNQFPMWASSRRTGLIEIVGVWGWPTSVPIEVKQACRILVAEFAKLQDAPLGMLGSAEFGMSRIPPQKQRHVRELLGPLVHPGHVGVG
jgi:hypothetical protein